MKRLTGIIITSLLLFTFSTTVSAQKEKKPFVGTITYEVTYPESQFDANTLAQLPKQVILKVSGKKSKMEMVGGAVTQYKITDGETKNSIALLDFMGQKFALKSNEKETQEAMKILGEVNIKPTESTKEIAGFLCKKAEVTFKNLNTEEETKTELYYNEELGSKELNFDTPYKDIDGIMLEYILNYNSIKMKFTAKKIEKGKVSEKEFNVPEGYQVLTKEELQQKFMSGGN